MKHIPITSSVMKSAGYDLPSWTLEIKFMSDEAYRYLRVPCLVFVELINSTSAGEYFNEHIKGRYESHRVYQKQVELDLNQSED
jgi:hypothetical protein